MPKHIIYIIAFVRACVLVRDMSCGREHNIITLPTLNLSISLSFCAETSVPKFCCAHNLHTASTTHSSGVRWAMEHAEAILEDVIVNALSPTLPIVWYMTVYVCADIWQRRQRRRRRAISTWCDSALAIRKILFITHPMNEIACEIELLWRRSVACARACECQLVRELRHTNPRRHALTYGDTYSCAYAAPRVRLIVYMSIGCWEWVIHMMSLEIYLNDPRIEVISYTLICPPSDRTVGLADICTIHKINMPFSTLCLSIFRDSGRCEEFN